jgi:fructosamine-3-kinase
MIDLPAEISAALGRHVVAMTPLGGGDVADSYRVTLDDGGTVFAKTKVDADAEFFVTEAAGLTWLHSAQAVSVPEVLAVSSDPPLLVQQWVEPGDRTPSTEVDFGRALAALHRSGAPFFGREDRRMTTSRGLPNEPMASWPEFYAGQRLLPLARLCRDSGSLPVRAIADLESTAARVDDLAGADEPPARLHGDLWAGNRLIGNGGVSWVIDPAAFGGHREFDLAMMRLFGGFGGDCYAAYNEVFPLGDGWERRVALHQLAPLAVHAIKFGGPYVAATQQALDSLK